MAAQHQHRWLLRSGLRARVATRTVDQRQSGGQWVPLGTYPFTAGTEGSVLIRTEDTDGHVIADAVRFVRA